MLKYPKSNREIIPADRNFFINPGKKINLKNISGNIISVLRKKTGQLDSIVSVKTLQHFFLKNPFRLKFCLKQFEYLVATLISKQFPIFHITAPGIKVEPVSASSMTFAITSRTRENSDHITGSITGINENI